MDKSNNFEKAVVHVSGTLLRRVWSSNERNNCILVRPAGHERDTIAFVVNQVSFDGPSNMVYGATKRTKIKEFGKDYAPNKKQIKSAKSLDGHVSTLNGFDNSILVYIEADESVIYVQAHEGDKFISFKEFRSRLSLGELIVPTINPLLDIGC